jgi:ketosteroid isomerase-like protein
MSKNLDLVRSIYPAWEQGDFSDARWADASIEFSIADGPEPREASGQPAMAAAMGASINAWDRWRVQPEQFVVLDDGRILVLVRYAARGRTSGLELASEWTEGANLFDIRAGKVTRLRVYFDQERALADLGLKA